jgi:hypothetical protein
MLTQAIATAATHQRRSLQALYSSICRPFLSHAESTLAKVYQNKPLQPSLESTLTTNRGRGGNYLINRIRPRFGGLRKTWLRIRFRNASTVPANDSQPGFQPHSLHSLRVSHCQRATFRLAAPCASIRWWRYATNHQKGLLAAEPTSPQVIRIVVLHPPVGRARLTLEGSSSRESVPTFFPCNSRCSTC